MLASEVPVKRKYVLNHFDQIVIKSTDLVEIDGQRDEGHADHDLE